MTQPAPPSRHTLEGTAGAPYARRWWALLVLSLSLLLIGLDNTIVNVALPTLVRELDATNSQLQWVVDAYVLVFAGLLLTAGSLGDRFGRKGALNAGLLIFATGSVASAWAGSANHLIVTRAMMGLGGAFIMPSTLSILTNIFPPHERGRAIGIWAGVAGIGIPLGPLVGGWLLDRFWWGSIFLVNVPLVVLALAAGALLIPTSRDAKAHRVDWRGGALSVVALGALLYGIIEAPNLGWTSGGTMLAFAIGVVFLALFVWWERRVAEPMLDLRFFRSPRFTAANAAITLVFFALFGSIFSLTQYLQFVLGYSPLGAGARMVPMAVGMMIGAPLSPRIVERVGTKAVVAAGLLIVAVGLVLASRMTVGTGYGLFLASLLVVSTGMGLTMAPATESVMGSIPRSKAGVGSAMNDTTRQLGGALGVAVIGSLMASSYRGNLEPALASLPAHAAGAARDSLGAALAVAQQAGVPDLAHAASVAFVDAMSSSLLVGAGVAVFGAIAALIWLPASGEDAGEEF